MVFMVLYMLKISEKIVFHLPTGGLACFDGGRGSIASSRNGKKRMVKMVHAFEFRFVTL